jgi:hypothetical protein
MTIYIISIIAIFFIAVLLVYLLLKLKKDNDLLKKKYSKIMDVDAERENIIKEIGKSKNEKEILLNNYKTAHFIYDKLQKEINLLEDTVEMMEFGVYKPNFNFDTSDEYKNELLKLREYEKTLIRTNDAIKCSIQWTVGNSKAEGTRMTKQNEKLMMRAFNGECDAAIANIKWNNASKMEERVKKAFETINKSGEVTKTYITTSYLEAKLKELRLAFEYEDKKYKEKEEQRQIREEMREEEKAKREIEQAKEDAEKEEDRYKKALEKAKEDILKASGEKLEQLNGKIVELENQLKEAQANKERAISRAQLTKSGHVYIISNIGTLGSDIYKIGMTRRLDPQDRVKELGDSAVPFPFDVHAFVFSENAPEMEKMLHNAFDHKRINLVNPRKEFFYVTLDEIEKFAKEKNIDIKFTKMAEAREFRESKALREKGNKIIQPEKVNELPLDLNSVFEKN